MLIENKDLPNEFVSIRQVWLQQINRVTESITHRYMQDSNKEHFDKVGIETVIESVVALHLTLVDYGEATVQSDVTNWIKVHSKDKIQDKS